MNGNFPSEDARYRLYRLGAHFCWWSALAWTAALTWDNMHHASMVPDKFQQVSGLFIVLLMGMGIALGSALARMRLGHTITQVFEKGMDVAMLGSKQRQNQIIHMLQAELDRHHEMEEKALDRPVQ